MAKDAHAQGLQTIADLDGKAKKVVDERVRVGVVELGFIHVVVVLVVVVGGFGFTGGSGDGALLLR